MLTSWVGIRNDVKQSKLCEGIILMEGIFILCLCFLVQTESWHFSWYNMLLTGTWFLQMLDTWSTLHSGYIEGFHITWSLLKSKPFCYDQKDPIGSFRQPWCDHPYPHLILVPCFLGSSHTFLQCWPNTLWPLDFTSILLLLIRMPFPQLNLIHQYQCRSPSCREVCPPLPWKGSPSHQSFAHLPFIS